MNVRARAFSRFALLALSTAPLLTPAFSHAQAVSTNGGSIQGTITDSSGAAVPNATVVISSPETGYRHALQTDGSGYYSLGPLVPGNYSLDITAPSFEKLHVNTVVRIGTATAGSEKLSIGNESTTVEVNAGQIQVNTDQPGVSGVITREQIETLPINGRNILDVAQVQPGVILQTGESFDPTKAGYSAISVGGASGRTTRILLDGQDITDETVGTTIYNVPTGAIDEFQLNRSTQDVSGEVTSTGQTLLTTRAGTNVFHGQLFYDFQDYRAGFAAVTGGYNAPFQRNEFGGAVGGPIIKDKLFFFGDIERTKQDQQTAATTSATFAAIQAEYPTFPSPFRDTYSTIRLDYNAPKNIRMFARAVYSVNSDASNFNDLYSLYLNRDNVPGIVGGADYATGRFTHSFRVGYEKFHNILGDGTNGVSSIYNPFPGQVTLIDSTDNFYAGPNFLAPQGTFQSDKQFRYDGTWTKGTHTLKFGYNLNRLLGGGFAAFYGASLYTTLSPSSLLANCNGVAGSAPCPDDPVKGYSATGFVLGNGNGLFTEKPGFGLPGGGVEDWREGAYVADTWKATSYLTLVAGLRWSVDTDRANQDVASPLCSSVSPSLQFSGCSSSDGSGNTYLFNQFGAGLGGKTHQPYANFGPQFGFVLSPGDHKTSLRGGIGIFYESDIFNNTSNARPAVVQANGDYFNYTTVCGGTNTVVLPNGTAVTSVNGTSLATICGESIANAEGPINQLKAEYQQASQGGGPNPSFIGTGGELRAGGIYGAPYLTPYSLQINGGVQREVARGVIVSADYVHNSTYKAPLVIDKNHVGAARYLNATAARNAISATVAACGVSNVDQAIAACPGLHTDPTTGAISGATIGDFAANGLDSINQYTGGVPAAAAGMAPAAFAGANPNVGLGEFILPVGRSGYDALQLVLQEQKSHPVPGIVSSNVQVSYSLSRIVSPLAGGNTDEFFNNVPYDFDNPNYYLGRTQLDHSNELSFGGSLNVKYGLRVGLVGHFFSAPASTLVLDNGGNNPFGAAAGEIFRSDITGDGTTGDPLPGYAPGSYMHALKGASLNKAIAGYNASSAGQPTPAGRALINAGLLSLTQLQQLNGVQQQIALAPGNPLPNSAFRAFDASVSYPIRLSKIREGMSLEPGVSMFNVANMSNFNLLNNGSYTLANVADAGGTVGTVNNYLNGPNNPAVQNGLRTQRSAGTFDQGAPRSTEFELKLIF